jgi:putative signal transducing protein
MFCPECGSEYRQGFTRCSDCDRDLVSQPPARSDIKLVKVFESANPALLPVVKSLLEGANIEFLTNNEPAQDLFGHVNEAVEFLVREEDVEAAQELLAEIELPPPSL